MLARLRNRPGAVDRPALRAFASRYAQLPVWTAMAADVDLRLGRADDAQRSLLLAARDDFAVVTGTRDGLFTCAVLAEPAAALGTDAIRRRLYDMLAPHAALNPVMDHGWAAWGPVERPLGLLAAALGRPGDAAGHLERAAALARTWGAAGWSGSRSSSSPRCGRSPRPSASVPPSSGPVGDRSAREHDAVALARGAPEPVGRGDRVAAAAPAPPPRVAQDEALRRVAHERAGVQVRPPALAEAAEDGLARQQRQVRLDHQQHGAVLGEPLAPAPQALRLAATSTR